MSSPYPILVVDDTQTQLGMSAAFSQYQEYRIIEASSFQDALQRLQADPIDVMLIKWETIQEEEKQDFENLRRVVLEKQIPMFIVADNLNPQERLEVL